MKLTIETEDGTVYEAEGNDSTWMCLADRVRFEKRFGVSTVAMQAWQEAAPAEGEDTIDISKVSKEALQYMREEHLVFFIWCELKRRVHGGLPPFDELIEQAVDYEIDTSDGGEADAGGPSPEPPDATSPESS